MSLFITGETKQLKSKISEFLDWVLDMDYVTCQEKNVREHFEEYRKLNGIKKGIDLIDFANDFFEFVESSVKDKSLVFYHGYLDEFVDRY